MQASEGWSETRTHVPLTWSPGRALLLCQAALFASGHNRPPGRWVGGVALSKTAGGLVCEAPFCMGCGWAPQGSVALLCGPRGTVFPQD